MLLIEEAIIQELLASPAIAGETGNRVSTRADQQSPLPYVVVRPYSSVPFRTHDGATGRARSGVQIEVYHETTARARRLADRARLAIEAALATRDMRGLAIGYAEVNFVSPDEPRQRAGSGVVEHQALLDCEFIHEIETP